ncbi:sulfatase family protein [Alienimonas chondri]|uniref:Sulfatase N-terminal domain-containing protein n=1 Tax=Alienimonas chondri TaxID=2681879 RepID=A0ABX1VIR7_9PLAN|nr:sulfatase [Alienimonas chondri]NNJ27336.1 hypothetical protein [Alienimonas chondri]
MTAALLPLLAFAALPDVAEPAATRPNILWIVVEDMSCHFGYQGELLVNTPHVDRLAADGVVFENAYVTAPVCSACRSALITGMYQTSIGAHHHRSSRGTHKIRLPAPVVTTPELFRAAGYYTCNLSFSAGERPGRPKPGKEDYNFEFDRAALYDGADWSGREDGQPFFAQVQLHGGKIRGTSEPAFRKLAASLDDPVAPDEVELPPYYPDLPAFRADWAAYLNTVQRTDEEVGLILDRLEREGLREDTVVYFLTDHGISSPRGKQFLYDEGAKIPLIVSGPGLDAGVRVDPVLQIDLAADSLSMAGVEAPAWMQGRPLFGPTAEPRSFVALARDRCDETEDRIRGIRAGDFKYLRNDRPTRPYLQPCAYKDHKPFMIALRASIAAGGLNAVQSLHLAESRPDEELYDLSADPWEVRNLAADPAYAERLAALRETLNRWEIETGDLGREREPLPAYEAEMEAYLTPGFRARKPEYSADVEANVELMKRWRAAGR